MYFEDIDMENVKAYVNAPIHNGSIGKLLNDCIKVLVILNFLVFIAFTASKGSIYLMIILFLVAFILCICAMHLHKDKGNKEAIILLIGICNGYISLDLLIFTYMVVSTVSIVPLLYAVLGAVLYIIIGFNLNSVTLNRIRTGYYISNNAKDQKFNLISSSAGGGFAIVISKTLLPNISQNGIVLIMSIIALVFSIVFLNKAQILLKYYFIKALNLYVESEWIE